MTPLQTAAQAAIKQCEADAIWAAYPWVGAKLIELSKALADEQAQAVEPVAWMYDWQPDEEVVTDWLTTDYAEAHSPTMGNYNIRPLYTHPAPPPATGERAKLIAELRGSADLLQIGKVEDWDGLAAEILQAVDMLEADGKPKNFLRLRGQLEQEWAEVRALKEASKSKAQQVAVRQAVEPTLSEILAAKGITLQKTFVEKPRDPVGDATTMVGERATLIKNLRKCDEGSVFVYAEEAADMLEADAKAKQVAVPDGYALVPIEPTQEMISAGQDLVVHDTAYEDYRGVYKAMIAAAQGARPEHKPDWSAA